MTKFFIVLIMCSLFANSPDNKENERLSTRLEFVSINTIDSDAQGINQGEMLDVNANDESGQKSETMEVPDAFIGLLGVLLGAVISGLTSIFLAFFSSKNDEKERAFKAEQDRIERIQIETTRVRDKKAETYLEFLKAAYHLVYSQKESRKMGLKKEEISRLQQNLLEEFVINSAAIQMYGTKDIIESANRIIDFIKLCETDNDKYSEEWNKFLELIKADLQSTLLTLESELNNNMQASSKRTSCCQQLG